LTGKEIALLLEEVEDCIAEAFKGLALKSLDIFGKFDGMYMTGLLYTCP